MYNHLLLDLFSEGFPCRSEIAEIYQLIAAMRLFGKAVKESSVSKGSCAVLTPIGDVSKL